MSILPEPRLAGVVKVKANHRLKVIRYDPHVLRLNRVPEDSQGSILVLISLAFEVCGVVAWRYEVTHNVHGEVLIILGNQGEVRTRSPPLALSLQTKEEEDDQQNSLHG
jgi:hypothetical protein